MKLRSLATCSAILAATCALAQDATKPKEPKDTRRLISYMGPDPNPAVHIKEAHVRITNREGLGVVIAIDEFTRREGDGIVDRVVILQGADEVAPFDGVAMVQIRKPADLCKPPEGTNLLDPEHPWVCPAAPEEILIDGKGINLAAFVGARSSRVPEDAVIPSRMVGISVYTGRMVQVPFAQLDAVEFAQQ